MRPQTLNSFVGNQELLKRLRVHLQASRITKSDFPHTLLTGPAGLGKTTLARIIANELQLNFVEANAATLKSVDDCYRCIKPNTVLFIDEVHALKPKVFEVFYPILEDKKLTILNRYQERIQVKLPHFTFIGATTDEGLLPKPFRDRMILSERLKVYSDEEMAQVVVANAESYNLRISQEDALYLAKTCRGVPRIAVNRITWLKDVAVCKSATILNRALIDESLSAIGVDQNGFEDADRAYIRVLAEIFDDGPASLKNIAAAADISEVTMREVVEPFLIRQGYISISARGRELTAQHKQYSELDDLCTL